MSTQLAVLMTKDEARACVDRIKVNFGQLRALLLDLYEREGWKALGYESWRECVTVEFQQSQSRVYQLLDAAKVSRNISTIVEKSESIPESQLRPLAGLEAQEQREVWQKAVETAPRGRITAAQLERLTLLKKFMEHRPEVLHQSCRLGDLALRYEENPDEPFVTQIDTWRFTVQRKERQ